MTAQEIYDKRIEEAAKFIAVKNAPLIGARLYDDCCYKSCIEAAAFALQNQWISVEEVLPELVDKRTGQSKVVYGMSDYGNVYVAYYDYSNDTWYHYNYYGYDPQIYSKITHWMPIPSLKGGKEDEPI